MAICWATNDLQIPMSSFPDLSVNMLILKQYMKCRPKILHYYLGNFIVTSYLSPLYKAGLQSSRARNKHSSYMNMQIEIEE